MKENVNLNSILIQMIKEYEQTHKVMTFSFTKIKNDFYYSDIDDDLLNEMNLLRNNIVNKRLQDICATRKIATELYVFYELAWNNQQSGLYTLNLNDTLYIIFFKLFEKENNTKIVKGHCIPICTQEELFLTDTMPKFKRSDFF
ncbi:hypothetical protein ICM_06333 [Bacillus cereus BAG1X2-3]|uniref:Uncharacterized protein n=1 Tax=Bacillus cereus TaxID=1396 RepID=A0A9X7E6T8_BACCE|nr:hypothetical protein [Bacillus cereus]EOO22101.1 hypothetical protein ICC_06594 [Bacillus cereus BAG1X1-1]EOO42377.1 hypothetical protein ICI_06538 [Bacillus cereus BAG1X2-1]EOO44003.1 hypothetical protein ICK_06562 [Bacillus cereus BAG1X2-2]EOO56031.1 hypothetical protein ICM_06333 [Bacillus cereus BAG1X2-3]EOO99971.1 hypothetical protein ICO_06743 [Bacillus cereus BAG2O-1]